MGIAKVIFNGETQMDVTQDTVTSNVLLSPHTATKADGTKVTGAIPTRGSASLTISGSIVRVSSGYYSTNYSKTVPAGSVTVSATTVISAVSHKATITPTATRSAGYITAGSMSASTITISAADLVLGNYSISTEGTYDITNYASVNVSNVIRNTSITIPQVIGSDVVEVPDPSLYTGFSQVTVQAVPLLSSKDVKLSQIAVGGINHTIRYDTVFSLSQSGYLPIMNKKLMGTIVSAGDLAYGSINIGSNGIYDVTNYSNATVLIPQSINNQNKIVTPDYDDADLLTTVVTHDTGYTGLGSVEIVHPREAFYNVTAEKGEIVDNTVTITPKLTTETGGYLWSGSVVGNTVTITAAELVSGTKSISYNAGAINVANYEYVDVNVEAGEAEINNQDKYVTPSTKAQTVTYDEGYTGLGQVTVDAMSIGYVDGPSLNIYSSSGELGDYIEITPQVIISPGYQRGQLKQGVAYIVNANQFVSGSIQIAANGTVDVRSYVTAIVNVPTGDTIRNQNKTVTPSILVQNITADTGYTGLGTVTVNAMPLGTINSPVAEKGTASNNSITITPKVTVASSGYIASGSRTGTAVTVSASELVSGTLTITSNGTKNVINYASVTVNVPTGDTINNQNKTVTPTTSQQQITADTGYTGLGTVTVNAMPVGAAGDPYPVKGPVTNYTMPVTARVTNTTGYITGGNKYGATVNVSAGELVSGDLAITTNGTKNVINYSTVTVNVPTGDTINNQNKSITLTTKSSTIIADSGYTGLGTVDVSVPYANALAFASAGTISSNQITIIAGFSAPSWGYVNSGESTYHSTATISAADLVSGTYNITANGTFNIVNYSSVNVSVAGGGSDYPADLFFYARMNGQLGNVLANQIGNPDLYNDGVYVVPSVKTYGGTGSLSLTYLASYAFAGVRSIPWNIQMPYVTTLQTGAFYSADFSTPSGDTPDLSSMFPNLTSFENEVFKYATGAFNVTFSNITEISYAMEAFNNCTGALAFNFPNATGIGTLLNPPNVLSIFYRCSHASIFSAPKVSFITGNSAFGQFGTRVNSGANFFFDSLNTIAGAYNFISTKIGTFTAPKLSLISGVGNFSGITNGAINFSRLTEISGNETFNGATISKIYLSRLTSIRGNGTFSRCYNLSLLNVSSLSEISGNYTFSECSALTTISLPSLTTISGSGFGTFFACTSLVSAVFPQLLTVTSMQSFFYGCSQLGVVDFHKLVSIYGNGAFARCFMLSQLIIRNSSVCVLGTTAPVVFSSTPLYNYSGSLGNWGSIYVPSSLVDRYKNATNWVTISSRITSIT